MGSVFFRHRLVERFGTGVLRIRDAYRGSERQPQFKVFENSILVILPLFVENMALSDDERRAYRELVGRPLQMSELTERTGFGRTKAQGIVKSLVNRGTCLSPVRARG